MAPREVSASPENLTRRTLVPYEEPATFGCTRMPVRCVVVVVTAAAMLAVAMLAVA
jgi:hypothetical protein